VAQQECLGFGHYGVREALVDEFARCYTSETMQVLVHDGHDVIRNLQFDSGPIAIGSHTDCPVYLPDLRVSLQQAVLVAMPGGSWQIDPVDLSHKTILNGRHITAREELAHGDEVIISDFVLKIYFEYQTDVDVARTVTAEEVAKIRKHPLPPGALIRKHNDPFSIPPGAERRLAEFGFELRQCADISRLMEVTLRTLVKEFDARLAWFGGRRQDYGRLEFVEGRTREGTTTVEPPALETCTFRCLERTQFLLIPRMDSDQCHSAMAVPLVSRRGRLGVLYVDSSPASPMFDLGHLDRLCLYASLAAVQLESIVQEQIRLQESIRAGELSFVREIQSRLDPTNVPQWDRLHFAVYCKPGLDHTGDIYDVMRMPNGLSTFFVAHVKGPPTQTALAMVQIWAAFRVAALHADPPHVFLREINWLLYDDTGTGCTASCCAIVTNPSTGAAEYATAGNIGAVVVDDCGEPRELADRRIPELAAEKNFAYASKSLRLMPEETVVLYTPGSCSVCDQNGHPLGESRLVESLCDGFGVPASDALNNLIRDLADFFIQGRQPDDITLVFVHRAEA
jgi:serine phosphatase RsbU (regulator of sigma subunit)